MIIKKGDNIKVNYEGSFGSGAIFDSSYHGDHKHPLSFVVGAGQVIKGFDEGVVGMGEGEEKEIRVKPSEGYGEYRQELKKTISKTELENIPNLKKGMVLTMQTPQGNIPLTIVDIKENDVVLDLNHPLVGKELIFNIKIEEIVNTGKEGNMERRFNGPRRDNRFGGGRRDFGPREMHKAVCAECKQECEVPFKPIQDKPVYCKECYSKRRAF